MVRFFGGKTRASSKDAAAPASGAKSEVGKATSAPAAAPAAPATKTPATTSVRDRRATPRTSTTAATRTSTTTTAPRASAAAAAPAPDGAEPAAKKTPVRRRTTATRPPRRDWAAEAAAAPMDGPTPVPSSLATAPVPVPGDETDSAAPATKRRRGTRGGRGRKKPGSISDTTALPTLTDVIERNGSATAAIAAPRDLSIEGLVAHQANVLEAFARDVTTTLRSLQTVIADLQSKVDSPSAAMTAHPRVGIFVDVPNLIYAAERRNINLDFGRVLDYFTRGRQLVRATAYAPISDDPQAKLESQRFVHYFIGHQYRLVTKPLKRFADGSMKANFDIELAIDILTMSDRLDVVVLMSGDGDFRRVVELIASRGVRVEVVAFAEAASSELKSVADLYVDVGAHLEEFKMLK